jgi:hypothetical protein
MTIDKRRTPAKPGQLPQFTPVPRLTQRHDGWSDERQHNFIAALADTGSVKAAAHRVNMTPEGAYLLRRHPDGASFRQAWEAALALGVQQLEDIAMERALYGQEVPVYSYGKLIGSRIVHNDRLLMFMLRNRAPTRFTADGRAAKRQNTIGDPDYANRLSRLKKQWRKEWEEEKAKADEAARDPQSTVEALSNRLGRMREHWLAGMSPRTRRLHDAFERAQELDTLREGRRQAFSLPASSGARLWDGTTLHPPRSTLAGDYLDEVLGPRAGEAELHARDEARLRRRHPERYVEEDEEADREEGE